MMPDITYVIFYYIECATPIKICLLRFDGDENEHFWKRISVVEVD